MNRTLNGFTGLYSLSKTLRFELKPEVETKKRFDNWIKEVESNNESTAENLINFYCCRWIGIDEIYYKEA